MDFHVFRPDILCAKLQFYITNSLKFFFPFFLTLLSYHYDTHTI